jgi:hypothetical protein
VTITPILILSCAAAGLIASKATNPANPKRCFITPSSRLLRGRSEHQHRKRKLILMMVAAASDAAAG